MKTFSSDLHRHVILSEIFKLKALNGNLHARLSQVVLERC